MSIVRNKKRGKPRRRRSRPKISPVKVSAGRRRGTMWIVVTRRRPRREKGRGIRKTARFRR